MVLCGVLLLLHGVLPLLTFLSVPGVSTFISVHYFFNVPAVWRAFILFMNGAVSIIGA
jgi:hypothetical protein